MFNANVPVKVIDPKHAECGFGALVVSPVPYMAKLGKVEAECCDVKHDRTGAVERMRLSQLEVLA